MIDMKKESIKESIISFFSPLGNQYDKLYEETGSTGGTSGNTNVDGPVKDDPDKNAEAPNLDGLFSNQNSVLFLTSPDKSGTIVELFKDKLIIYYYNI